MLISKTNKHPKQAPGSKRGSSTPRHMPTDADIIERIKRATVASGIPTEWNRGSK